jgi:DNA polymerase-1
MGNMAPKPVCMTVAWAYDNDVHTTIFKQAIIYSNIKLWLKEGYTLIGHNVAYDFACILAHTDDLELHSLIWQAYSEHRILCTKVREQLIDIAYDEFGYHWDKKGERKKHTYQLADICKRRFGVELDKGDDSWRLRYAELEHIPIEQWPQKAVQYALDDAKYTLMVYQEQEARAQAINYAIPTQWADTRASLALHLTTVWGAATDPEQVNLVWGQVSNRMAELASQLKTTGLVRPAKDKGDGLPAITRTMENIRALVVETYPGDPPRTDKGAISTTAEVLEECSHPHLKTLLEFVGLQKTVTTYLVKVRVPIVHASYNAVGARSDRTSSFNPNIQNQSKVPGVRECFVARPGYVYVAADYDSQEMRTLAQSCLDILGYSSLAQRYQEDPNFDPHLEFAAAMMGISVPHAESLLEQSDPEIARHRQEAKVANFGFPGGLGSNTFVTFARGWDLDISFERSEALKDMWRAQWPEMKEYFKYISSIAGHGEGTLIIPRSGFTRSGVGYCNAANGHFQTLAAHASKSAMYEVTRAMYDPSIECYLTQCRPILFEHDAIMIEAPEEIGHEAGVELEQIMIHEMNKWTPNVPAAASALIMRRWSKKAKRKMEGGRLIVWKP